MMISRYYYILYSNPSCRTPEQTVLLCSLASPNLSESLRGSKREVFALHSWIVGWHHDLAIDNMGHKTQRIFVMTRRAILLRVPV